MDAFEYETYGSPNVLKLNHIDKPSPKSNEVLIKIKAVSINPADWRRMEGDPFFIRFEAGLLKPKKKILGADVAGIVDAVGEQVTKFRIGDAVFGEIEVGGFAEYVCVSEDILAAKPANLTFPEAAAVPLAGNTALQGVRDIGQVQLGQSVLINGASGGVGTFAVQLAKHFGAHVTAVCSTRNVELVRSIGADEVIDYTKEDFANNGRYYDLIIDIVGDRKVAEYRSALNPTGRVVVIGFTTLPHMLKVLAQGALVSMRTQQSFVPLNATINTDDLAYLKSLLEAKKIKPVIDQEYAFNQIPEAVTYLSKGRARGKVVVAV
ncbi:MAG: NAD(P)-dependent alcohol dehydrogenase [Chloroflexota bacterium]